MRQVLQRRWTKNSKPYILGEGNPLQPGPHEKALYLVFNTLVNHRI